MKIWALGVVLFLAICASAQDDVHIVPRTPPPPPEAIILPEMQGKPIVKVDVNLVLIPVTVTDSDKNTPFDGLQKGHFELFEGKQQQEIKTFSQDDAPVSIGIIFDKSGSVGVKLDMEKAAIRTLCQQANPQDEMFLITFSDTIDDATEFNPVTDDITNSLVFKGSKGRTALLDAIYLGMQKMQKARYQRKAIIIVSDGGDNHSRYTRGEVENDLKEADLQVYCLGIFDRMVLSMEADAQIAMQTGGNRKVAMTVPIEELEGPALLEELSNSTGGRTFILEDPRDLLNAIAWIDYTLRHQYVLGYTPKNVTGDKKYRKISVKLHKLPKGTPFLRIDARKGFYPTN